MSYIELNVENRDNPPPLQESDILNHTNEVRVVWKGMDGFPSLTRQGVLGLSRGFTPRHAQTVLYKHSFDIRKSDSPQSNLQRWTSR